MCRVVEWTALIEDRADKTTQDEASPVDPLVAGTRYLSGSHLLPDEQMAWLRAVFVMLPGDSPSGVCDRSQRI